jgi:MFS transporter, DHA2 family, methylenomycin A resistance protein
MDTKRFSLDTTLTLIVAYLGLFVGLIDANAINLALPAIRDHLGGGISGAQWTIDAYNITFAAVLLTAGSLGDRFGRRKAGPWRPRGPSRWQSSPSQLSPRSCGASGA